MRKGLFAAVAGLVGILLTVMVAPLCLADGAGMGMDCCKSSRHCTTGMKVADCCRYVPAPSAPESPASTTVISQKQQGKWDAVVVAAAILDLSGPFSAAASGIAILNASPPALTTPIFLRNAALLR